MCFLSSEGAFRSKKRVKKTAINVNGNTLFFKMLPQLVITKLYTTLCVYKNEFI